MNALQDTPSMLPSGRLRPGLRVFAIGDIHGHADLLDRVASLVAEDIVGDPPAAALTVFVGDYIDRGPASAAVIDRLLRLDFPTPIITLRGNHEQMLLDALADAADIENWLLNGGLETARSYGVELGATFRDEEAFRRALIEAIPQTHVEFLNATRLSWSLDGYFFCHAGIEPGTALDQQAADVLLWIRQPFHASTADHGKVVVHGHTPVPKPDSRPNRINIDTGAFRTGRLSCLALQGDRRRFLSS